MVNDEAGPVLYSVGRVTALETCGRYELIRRIAVGGMAEIYLSRETGLAGFERLVIVKRILPNLAADTDFIDMFLDEARLAARLTHPNIVHIYELDEQAGTYFIAMEYVPGGDLHELVGRRRGRLIPLGDALYVVSEVCAGLQFAHALAGPDGTSLGVVHRDVTPKNVLLSVDGVVKVMDFGIAKARAKLSVTRPGDIKGTFSYMAPEQARGEAVDRRADIYAVGALLYRLTVGSPAYPQVGNALLSAVRAGQFVRPRKVNPDVPPVVEEIILRAMALDPKARHPTCGALRREIAEATRSLGIHADSETLAALVREAFPRVPGATVPVDEPPGSGEIRRGPAALVPPAAEALSPAGPDEATGLVSPDDLEIVDAQPLDPMDPADALASLPGSGPVSLEDRTDPMAMPGEADEGAPTSIVSQRQVAAPAGLQDLHAPPTDPGGGFPGLDSGDDGPTDILDLEDIGATLDEVGPMPSPSASSSPVPVGPPRAHGIPLPPPGSSPIPAPPPEPKVVVSSAPEPTATPILRAPREPTKKKSRRGTFIVAGAFFLGATLIAAAITLVFLPPTPPSQAAGGSGHESPAAPAPPEDPSAIIPETLASALAAPPSSAIPDASTGPAVPSSTGSTAGDPPPAPEPPPTKIEPPPERVLPPPRPAPREEVGSPPRERAPSPRPPSRGETDRPRTKTAASTKAPPPTRPREAPAPTGNTGYLTVWTTPYSKVYLGARLLGNTPMAKREVPAGRHRLKLVNPDLPPKTVSITVRSGEVTRVRQRL